MSTVNKNNKHLGEYFLHWISKYPNEIFQIDAATGEKETFASVLSRSIQLARSFRRLGLQPGDVLAIGGKNHLDIHIPYYAGLLNGLPVLGIDTFFKYAEIKTLFKTTKPRVVFCQRENYDIYSQTALDLELGTKIITFDEGDCSLAKFIEKYAADTKDEFKPADFDTDKVFAWLTCTSGTTGVPKVAAFKHHVILGCLEMIRSWIKPREGIRTIQLHLSPMQWISSFLNAMIVLYNSCKVQTSALLTTEHVIDMINKYRPTSTLIGPVLLNNIRNHEKPCDLTCFNAINIGGSKMHKDDLVAVKVRLRKDAMLIESYGQTETLGPVLLYKPTMPLGSCGSCIKDVCDVKLVDLETKNEITQPNVPGELYCKPRFMFSEYYNDQEETAKAFSADGWYKTGDLLHRDAENNYYFVDRIKSFIKYRGNHIYPGELEELIRTLNGVQDVCVTSIPHEEDGQLPVACVVRKPGFTVSAQDIKNIVAETLSENKQLRGGVVFIDELPLTPTGKVARMQLKQMIMDMQRD